MGSAFDDMFAESAMPTLMGLHGRTVTRWPHGHEGEAAIISAMWAPENTGDRNADISVRNVVYKGTLTIDAIQEYDKTDSWIIDGWRYQVVAGGHESGGLRYLKLELTDKITTSRHTGVL